MTERRRFDPFGKPRGLNSESLLSARLSSFGSDVAISKRGFTDHEHLDEAELIHMNGRVYDYKVGRFLSVDPIIQSPGNSQSINPYSYIMNNPLSGTDPTGYCGTKLEGRGGGSNCKVDDFSGGDQNWQNINTAIGNIGIQAVHNGAPSGQSASGNSAKEMMDAMGEQQKAKKGGQGSGRSDSGLKDSSGSPIDLNTLNASNGAGNKIAMSDELTEAQELFMSKHKLNKNHFSDLINTVNAIRSVGKMLDDKSNFNDLLDKLKPFELKLIADMNDISLGGMWRDDPDSARYFIMRSRILKNFNKNQVFISQLAEGSANLIYISPAMNRFKAGLPSKVSKTLDSYDNFNNLYKTLKDKE